MTNTVNKSLNSLLLSIIQSLHSVRFPTIDQFIEDKLTSLAYEFNADSCILFSRDHLHTYSEKNWYGQVKRCLHLDQHFYTSLKDKLFFNDYQNLSLPGVHGITVTSKTHCIEGIVVPGTKQRAMLLFVNAANLPHRLDNENVILTAIAHLLLRTYRKKLHDYELFMHKLLLRLSLEHLGLKGELMSPKTDNMVRVFLKQLDFERMTFLQVNSEDGLMYTTYSVSVGDVEPYKPNFPTTQPHKDLCFKKKFVIQSIPEDFSGIAPEDVPFYKHLPLRSVILTPIFIRGKLEAVIGCGRATSPIGVTKKHLHYTNLLASILGQALERQYTEHSLQQATLKLKQLKNNNWGISLPAEDDASLPNGKQLPGCYSQSIQETLNDVKLVAPTDCTVLLLGETGSGKELIASNIHALSPRRDKRMVVVNCAAVPQQLFESEFFGAVRGAFTSAVENRTGKFEMANGSTLFLDEIGELPLDAQAKLLRVIQEGEFERLGGTKTIQVDVRVIAATNRDLVQMVRDKQFRDDLYYRLCVYPIKVPPLRERQEDIPEIVWFFVREFEKRYGKVIHNISNTTMNSLQMHPWRGNIRELRNLIEKSVLRSTSGVLELDGQDDTAFQVPSSLSLEDMEREHIIKVLRLCNGKISGKGSAAELLQMDRSTLTYRIKKHNLNPKDFQKKPR